LIGTNFKVKKLHKKEDEIVIEKEDEIVYVLCLAS
jgi:hypothetical protein